VLCEWKNTLVAANGIQPPYCINFHGHKPPCSMSTAEDVSWSLPRVVPFSDSILPVFRFRFCCCSTSAIMVQATKTSSSPSPGDGNSSINKDLLQSKPWPEEGGANRSSAQSKDWMRCCWLYGPTVREESIFWRIQLLWHPNCSGSWPKEIHENPSSKFWNWSGLIFLWD
jgi:hypothetical protein